MDNRENDLEWHALNYRTASSEDAHAMWLELEACVARLLTLEMQSRIDSAPLQKMTLPNGECVHVALFLV